METVVVQRELFSMVQLFLYKNNVYLFILQPWFVTESGKRPVDILRRWLVDSAYHDVMDLELEETWSERAIDRGEGNGFLGFGLSNKYDEWASKLLCMCNSHFNPIYRKHCPNLKKHVFIGPLFVFSLSYTITFTVIKSNWDII